jgi:hypothetical protein
LAWIGLLFGLAIALPSPAAAEHVPISPRDPVLAVGRDGSPYVAEVFASDLFVAHRAADGWTLRRLLRLPSSHTVMAGLVVDVKGRWTALVEETEGGWLALARLGDSRIRIVARPKRGDAFGPAGLTLDAAGRPAFAYALQRPSGKSWLRLVTTDAGGRLHTHGITKGGFPTSAQIPGAAPVLVGKRLHVVETYSSAAIDWGPKAGGGWEGQFLFASRIGTPAGRVGAAANGRSLWSSWTQVSGAAINVLLTLSAGTQETAIVVDHGIFVSLLLDAGRPEVGAYDWVEVNDTFIYAGLLADGLGPFTELDGRLAGYARAPGGGRQLLLATSSGLEWFASPTRPAVRVSLEAEPSGRLSGAVDGASGGTVELYHETSTGRTLVATVPVAPDGVFAYDAPPPTSPTLYRAVYVDGTTGIPYASLLRTPVG